MDIDKPTKLYSWGGNLRCQQTKPIEMIHEYTAAAAEEEEARCGMAALLHLKPRSSTYNGKRVTILLVLVHCTFTDRPGKD